MSTVSIFRHHPSEGPGYLLEFLQREGIPCRIIRIDKNDPVPTSLDGISALVFMGGPMSVNDPLPWIDDELALIRLALEQDIPVLGHCLGGQLIAKAMGAEVVHNKVMEIGWHPVRMADTPTARDWLADINTGTELFHWHSETFTIPGDAARIMGSEFCDNQAFVYHKTLAMQCHIEMTETLVRSWVQAAADSLPVSASVQSGEEMQYQLGSRIRRLNRIADSIYSRWVEGL